MLPRPIAGFQGPTSKGRGGQSREGKGGGEDGRNLGVRGRGEKDPHFPTPYTVTPAARTWVSRTPPDTFYQYPGPVFGAGADGAVLRDTPSWHRKSWHLLDSEP